MSRVIGIGAGVLLRPFEQERHTVPRRRAACWDLCDDDCSLCDRYSAMLESREEPDYLKRVMPYGTGVRY